MSSEGAGARRTSPPSTSWAFVLGTGRCGSTLVHEVLSRHREVGFVSNVDDRIPAVAPLGRWNGALYRRLPPEAARKGRVRYAPSEAYRALDREVSPALSTPVRDLTAADVTPWLADRFRRFFEVRARRQGTPVFLHKFTGWPRARFVHEILPGARFVHVVRDGRAVANSWLQMPWWLGYRGPTHWQFGPLPPPYEDAWRRSGRSYVLLAGLAWMLLLDAYEEARTALPPASWMEVRYEDLVADPRGRVADIVAFLGIDWSPAFEAQLDRHRFGQGRSLAYRRDLGPEGLRLLDDAMGAHLARYGYV